MNDEITLKKRMKFGYVIFDIIDKSDLDKPTAMENFILENIPDNESNIIINFENIRFMSSSTLASIIKVQKDLTLKGINISIVNADESILSLFKTTEVIKLVKIIESEEDLMNRKKQKELDEILDEPLIS